MNDKKDDTTGELDDDKLVNVSGGVGGAGGADPIVQEETTTSTSGAGAGKVSFTPFSITRKTDKASSS
jgi:hypothetical protein